MYAGGQQKDTGYPVSQWRMARPSCPLASTPQGRQDPCAPSQGAPRSGGGCIVAGHPIDPDRSDMGTIPTAPARQRLASPTIGEVAFAKQMTERCQGRFVGSGCPAVWQLDTSQSRLRRASSPIVGEPRALTRHRTVGRPEPGRRCRQPERESAFVSCSNVRLSRRGGPCGRPGRQLQYEPALPIAPARPRQRQLSAELVLQFCILHSAFSTGLRPLVLYRNL